MPAANDDRVGMLIADPEAGVTQHVFPDGAAYEVKDGVTTKCVRPAEGSDSGSSEPYVEPPAQ